jgi:pimeloyl-ACP methyl ester carboxylesterase
MILFRQLSFCFVFTFALMFFLISVAIFGQETGMLRKIDEKIPVKTAGGILFWGDILFFHDWHIQENVKTNSYRLLDSNSVQRAYGTFEDCQHRLDEIQAEEGLLPMSGTAVIVLHGFGSNAMTTRTLVNWLREKKVYDYVFGITYPSTMQPILDHARMFERVIKNLPPTIKKIDLIGHSLGGIVVRRYLSGPLDADWQVADDPIAARKQFSPDERIGRFVMLGPPNHGSVIAAKLIGNDPVRRFFAGKSGDELGVDWKETEKTLGIPCCPFAIISGGRGDERGFSMMIPGDDDGIVSTEGTYLDGAEAWIRFDVGHGEMLLTEEIFETVLRFLKTGSINPTK